MKIIDACYWGVHAAAVLACAVLPGHLVCVALGSADPTLGAQTLARWPVLLANTALVAGTAVAVAVAGGLPLGALLFRTTLFGRRIAIAVLILLVCMPLYVSGTGLMAIIGIPHLQESAVAAGMLHGLVLLPLAGLVIGTGLLNAPQSCEDVALLDTSPLGVLWHISLPTCRWHVGLAALLVLFVSATDTFLTDVLQVRTFAEEIYTQNALHGIAANTAILGLPLTVVLALLFALAWRTRPAPGQAGPAPRPLDIGLWRYVLAITIFALLLTMGQLVLSPLLREIGGRTGFVSATRSVLPDLQTSLWTGPLAATLCAALAPGIGWTMLHTRGLRWILLAIMLLLLCTPAAAVGIALIQLLDRPGWAGAIYDSPIVLVVGLTVRFLPLAVLVMTPALERIPREIREAALLDGVGAAAMQHHVVWPLCRGRIAVVWFIVLVFCFGETVCSVLIAPPGYTPLAVRFFTLIHYGINREAATVVLLTISSLGVPSLLLAVALLRGRSR